MNPWLPPCEICAGPSRKELRGVEHRGRRVRNARPVAVNGSIGGHDPPRSSGELPGRYGHRLLPVCCPGAAVARTFATQSEPAARRRVKTGGARTWRGTGLAGQRAAQGSFLLVEGVAESWLSAASLWYSSGEPAAACSGREPEMRSARSPNSAASA